MTSVAVECRLILGGPWTHHRLVMLVLGRPWTTQRQVLHAATAIRRHGVGRRLDGLTLRAEPGSGSVVDGLLVGGGGKQLATLLLLASLILIKRWSL
jgi:hypothetical protein